MNIRVSHHLLLCATSTKSLCCNPKNGIKSWEKLKRTLQELNLEDPKRAEGIVLRSKVDCLRVCSEGPILLIWPEGTWYHKVTPNLIELIVKEHIIRGEPINEFIFKRMILKE